MIKEIKRGNREEVNCGEVFDVSITESNGNKIFFHYEFNGNLTVSKIAPLELQDEAPIAWGFLPQQMKEAYFQQKFPNEENPLEAWAKSHKVLSDFITVSLCDELGPWDKAQVLKTWSQQPGTCYKSHILNIDDKYLVKFCSSGPDEISLITVEKYSDYVKAQKSFGRRVSKLSREADVPWKIGVFAGNIASDKDAIMVLKKIREATPVEDSDLLWELSCGINRRNEAIKQVLGEEIFSLLSCKGQNQTKTLALYLSGRQI